MKRIVSLVLVLILTTVMSVNAFAVENGSDSEATEQLTLSDIKEEYKNLIDHKDTIADQKVLDALDVLTKSGAMAALLGEEGTSRTQTKSFMLISPAVYKGQFDLETRLQNNAQSMRVVFDAAFNAYLSINPVMAYPQAYMFVGVYFASQVKGGGDWDYKATLGTTSTYRTLVNGSYYSLTGEQIGNINYGYVGKTYFASGILKSAAGVVQIASGTADIAWFSSYFDDPRDQVEIQRGIDYYDTGVFN